MLKKIVFTEINIFIVWNKVISKLNITTIGLNNCFQNYFFSLICTVSCTIKIFTALKIHMQSNNEQLFYDDKTFTRFNKKRE